MLSGGGEAAANRDALDLFLSLVGERAGSQRPPRVASVVAAAEPRWQTDETRAALRDDSASQVVSVEAIAFADGTGRIREPLDPEPLLTADGIFIGDGDPAALLAALEPVAVDIRRLISEGTPFFGLGAGAVVAAEAALVGGFEIGGVAVAPGLTTDGDSEVRFAAGLGLVDLPVVAAAAQLGRVGLAIACCEADLAAGMLAIDEGTTLVVAEGALDLIGGGSLWQVRADRDDDRGGIRVVVETVRAQ